MGYLDQTPELPPGTVRAAVGEGWEADAALDRLGMAGAVDALVTTLSGGQAKRVALARVLTHPAELLVLDEPTNHLDLGAVAWLEHRLLSFRGGLVMVTHDRHLLNRLTTRMLELDRGHAYFHDGGYGSYLEARAERESRRCQLRRPGATWPAANWRGCAGAPGPVPQAAGPRRRRRPPDRGTDRPPVGDGELQRHSAPLAWATRSSSARGRVPLRGGARCSRRRPGRRAA